MDPDVQTQKGALRPAPECPFEIAKIVNLDAQLRTPGLGAFDGFVHGVDVLHTLIGEPVFEGLNTLFAIDLHTIEPGGAAAEDAGVVGTAFGSEFEVFD